MKLIIIGSGIAGLASAVRLQAMGFDVTVLEANNYFGGKLTEFNQNGFRFDAGPSLFTLPQLVLDLFDIAKQNKDKFEFQQLEKSCNYFYEDGTRFTSFHNAQKMTSELQEKLGETKKSYADLKLAHAVSPLENPIQLRSVRRTVARIATELTKRELQ